ncbi:MAG: bifunctional DNA primase/polymerase [Dehalococcoidia bacterium]|nr:bifunctional DNA primase/polymerase [Dehalococcoidia bacterium]
MEQALDQQVDLYVRLGLSPIPLKPRYKVPLVKRRVGWNPGPEEVRRRASTPGINFGVHCSRELVGLDFDSEEEFQSLIEVHPEAVLWPRVKTGRSFHLWVQAMKRVRSRQVCDAGICIGSYPVAPPSLHPGRRRGEGR